VEAAVREGRFHVYSVETVEDAIELFFGLPAGTPDKNGSYPVDTVYGRVERRLQSFDRILTERAVQAS
jgi:predicted ATP-dependent protease